MIENKKQAKLLFGVFLVAGLAAVIFYLSYFIPIGNREALFSSSTSESNTPKIKTLFDSTVGVITAPQLKSDLEAGKNYRLIDTNSQADYQKLHIPDSVNSSLESLSLDMLDETAEGYVFICASYYCVNVEVKLNELNWPNAFVIIDGVQEWKNQGYDLEGEKASGIKTVTEISAVELNELITQVDKTIVIIDLRSSDAFAAYHLPKAINVAFDAISKIDESQVSKSADVIVLYDEAGLKSGLAAQELMRKEYQDVSSLTGGLDAWAEAGYKL